jgi:DNA-binding CsgD family transcriptional regulator
VDLRRSAGSTGPATSRLSGADLDRVGALWESVGRDGADPLDPRGLLVAVGDLVGCEYASITEIDDRHGRSWSWHTPGAALPTPDHAGFSRHAHEHPVLRHVRRVGQGGPWRISDVADRRHWHSLPLYDVFFRPLRVEHQAAFAVGDPRGEIVTAVAFNRSTRDFSDRDVAMLSAVRPLVSTLHRVGLEYRRARASLVGRAAAVRGGVAVVGRAGQLEWADATAAAALEAVFPGEIRPGAGVPAGIWSWLARSERSLEVRGEPAVLTLRRGPRLDGRAAILVDPPGRTTAPLSQRQRQVLELVEGGLSNRQVAARLGISGRTVDKHLENAYARLGVDNRVSAVRSVFWR